MPLNEKPLAKCPLFQGMTPSERAEVFGLLETQSFSPEQTIIGERESLQFVWIVLKGTCQIVKDTSNGNQRELAVIGENDVFGEMSFFCGGAHSATVRAQSEVEVARLPREKYDLLLRVGSIAAYKLAFNTVGVLTERLRKTIDWVGKLMEKSGQEPHHEEWQDFRAKLLTGWKF
jgi:CRP-like cAMP-binding protein